MRLKLSQVFDLQMGKTPSRNSAEYWGGNHKWVSIADIGNAGKYISETKECITDDGVSGSGIKVVPKGTVIMSFKLSIGKTTITSEDMYTNEAIMAFVDKGIYPVDPNYLYHLCCGTDWTAGTNKAVMGLTLNKATLSEKMINLPSVEEQKDIAEKLDEVDSLINIQQRQLAKLDELVKSRFIELFIGKGYPVTSIKELLVQNSTVEKISNTKIEKFVTVGIKGKGAREREIKDGKWPVPFSGYRVKEGQFIYSRIDARNGAFAILPKEVDGAVVSKDFPVFEIKADKMLPNVLLFSVLQDDFVRQIQNSSFGATNRQRIQEEVFGEYTITLPPMEIQNQFAAFVEQTDKSKLAIQESLAELETLKKALMQKYFG